MEVLSFLSRGGLVMYPLLLCSVIGVAIIIERGVSLRRRHILVPEIIRVINSIDSEEDVRLARSICKQNQGPFANIILVGLDNRELAKDDIKELFEEQGRQEVRVLERGLPTLETVASISPLLGLLGTVIGMIKVFTVISRGGAGQASLLAGGISEALITTATGLVIAIPMLVAYNAYINRAESFVLDIEKYSTRLLQKLKALSTPQEVPK
jgi:biopolymer transport protein ExbB